MLIKPNDPCILVTSDKDFKRTMLWLLKQLGVMNEIKKTVYEQNENIMKKKEIMKRRQNKIVALKSTAVEVKY